MYVWAPNDTVEAYVTIKELFSIVVKDGPTLERRLQIDIFALLESY